MVKNKNQLPPVSIRLGKHECREVYKVKLGKKEKKCNTPQKENKKEMLSKKRIHLVRGVSFLLYKFCQRIRARCILFVGSHSQRSNFENYYHESQKLKKKECHS